MNVEEYNVEIPQGGDVWEGLRALGSTPIAKVENYRVMIDAMCATDEYAKNNDGAIICAVDTPEYERYEESKHKEQIVKAMIDCLLTGYELDKTIHFDNEMNIVYHIHGDPIVCITQADYQTLAEEAETQSEKLWSELMHIAAESYEPASRLFEIMDEVTYRCQGTSAKNIYKR